MLKENLFLPTLDLSFQEYNKGGEPKKDGFKINVNAIVGNSWSASAATATVKREGTKAPPMEVQLDVVKGYCAGDGRTGYAFQELQAMLPPEIQTESLPCLCLSLLHIATTGWSRLIPALPGFSIQIGETVLKPKLNLLQLLRLQIYGRLLLKKHLLDFNFH